MLRVLSLAILLAPAAFAQSADLTGDWTGEIHSGSVTLHMALHLSKDGGTLESVDQHATLPIKSVERHDRSVTLNVGVAQFTGALDDSGQLLTGTFEQGPARLPLVFHRGVVAPLPVHEPVRPFPYAEEQVRVTSGGVWLTGTLTHPKTGGFFPAALLITGSGPQDRDETIFGHKPFLVLSDALTRRGFAVLRLDDRGTGGSGGVFADATYEDKVADVLAAIAFLKTRKEIDPVRIGLIGHSEGGSIGPLAAVRSPNVAFVILMAGMGVPGAQVLRQQGIDVIRAAGGSDSEVQRQVETQAQMFAILRETPSRPQAEARLRQLLGSGPAADQQIRLLYSSTIRDLLAFDPGPVLQALSCPVLALNGSHDRQVSPTQNLPAIAAALAASKSSDWTVTQLPRLNHLFQTAPTGAIGEYATLEETLAPAAITAITDWLGSRFLRSPH